MPLLIVGMGVVVGFIVISLFLPILITMTNLGGT
jgi:type II secretory pathway component PulF